MPGGSVTLDASASSQFISALLLAGSRFDQGVTVRHHGAPVPSAPHIAMTVEVLRDCGVVVDDSCFSDGQLPRLLDELQNCLAGHFDVEHSTFQFEAHGHVEHERSTHH